ncbi:CorA family divalent cation transporter [Lacicoccus qingdaonensis]|uniref:Magnesium transporter n=1 Tax=Lacicoccus qingdaonensis TaxID=576118 RepID=A0A1G9BMT1_9BACL|nr:CorA family divalent cation transporter [Salinicoccus qingdaonensis]SDK40819.1 magnesium transporter [Salinicoccus qingdaonensis]
MSLSIQYISKNNEIEKVENKEQVPEHAAFIWYDYDSFDDKEQLKRNHDLDDIRLEDEAIKTYRPAYYKSDDYQLLICHVINRETLEAHAVNVCVMQDVIITFHNGVLEQFINIEEIIKDRNDDLEIDIALHILLNTIDQYFDIVHEIEDEVILFEEKHADDKKGRDITSEIFNMKKKVFRVKRVIIPMEELVEKFKEQDDVLDSKRSEYILNKVNAKIDRQKLIIQFSEEMIDEIKDNYMSYNTYRMNRIINVLTIISAIFLPLTLITGIYGMNFDNMPELNWDFGYFMALGIMLIISVSMLAFFKSKKWM